MPKCYLSIKTCQSATCQSVEPKSADCVVKNFHNDLTQTKPRSTPSYIQSTHQQSIITHTHTHTNFYVPHSVSSSKALDFRSIGRGFNSHRQSCITTLGKFFTPTCMVPQSPSSITRYPSKDSDALRLGKSGEK